jgi:hypothetical protein
VHSLTTDIVSISSYTPDGYYYDGDTIFFAVKFSGPIKVVPPYPGTSVQELCMVGTALVQVATRVESDWFERLKLKYGRLLSSFAFTLTAYVGSVRLKWDGIG